MLGTTIRRRGAWAGGAALAVLATTLVAACGGSSSNGSSSSGSSASSGSGKGITVRAAEFTWTAAELTDDILAQVVKQHPELGVSKITTKTLDPAPGFAGAERGDIDLLTEVDWPNQQPLEQKAAGQVSLVSTTYTGAAQGWFVPSYAVAPGGKAAGLKSVTQLNQYKSAFGGKLIDGDPGWQSTAQNDKRLKGYGVDYQHVTASEAAELAQLKRAYTLHQPIVLYLWHPLWVFAKYKLTQLSEPHPYSPSCFTTGNGACAMSAYSAKIAARKDLKQKAPKFWAMLTRFKVSLPDMEQMLLQVDAEKKPAMAVAQQYVAAHQSAVNSWVNG